MGVLIFHSTPYLRIAILTSKEAFITLTIHSEYGTLYDNCPFRLAIAFLIGRHQSLHGCLARSAGSIRP